MAMPGVMQLVELGFHWHICARAIATAGGNVDAAAGALFELEDPSAQLRELEVRC